MRLAPVSFVWGKIAGRLLGKDGCPPAPLLNTIGNGSDDPVDRPKREVASSVWLTALPCFQDDTLGNSVQTVEAQPSRPHETLEYWGREHGKAFSQRKKRTLGLPLEKGFGRGAAVFTSMVFIAALVTVLLASCRSKEPDQPYRMNRLLLGTLVEISLVGESDKVKPAAAAIFDEMRRVEDLTSFHKPSKLTEINDHAGLGPFPADGEVLKLIEQSLGYAQKFDGTFDPTIGSVTRLWHFSGDEPPRLPDPSEITEALTKVGWRQVKVDAAAGTIDLPTSGMALDLGGIAKGYALERAAAVARSFGVTAALINAGGDLVALGEKRPGVPWRVGVQHPRRHDAIAAVVDVRDRVVFTSGDYERFFDQGGTRYHHILDPRTGYPAPGVQSVTIVAKDILLADALAKAVFILGPERGLKLVESMPEVDALLIDAAGGMRRSRGATDIFQIRQ